MSAFSRIKDKRTVKTIFVDKKRMKISFKIKVIVRMYHQS